VFGILELTRPSNIFIRGMHRFYLKSALPVLGKLLTKNKEAYSYLCNSIQSFLAPQELIEHLRDAGFRDIRQKNLAFGTAAIFLASK
jgi:demethylmenaquinone methyltransferase/2-methoxy-6-polyprenyl-1,4-benzoquinol methylase